MRERGFDGDVAERGEIALQKGPARGRENDALDLDVATAAQRLMHGVVLGIDGKDLAAMFRGGARHHVAGGDEDFLVGDADALARAERGVDGRDAGGADDGGNDRIGRGHRRHGRRALDAGDDLDAVADQAAQTSRIILAAHGDELGAIARDLLGQQLDVRAGGESHDAQLFRERIDDGERGLADGTGAAEDGEGSHFVC